MKNMKNIFSKIISSLAIFAMVFSLAGSAPMIARAQTEELPIEAPKEEIVVLETVVEKINICHATASESNPWEAVRIDASAWNSGPNHEGHGDFYYTGPVNPQNQQPAEDGDGWCKEMAPEEEVVPASIELTKTALYDGGHKITYTITWKITGANVTDLTISDTLPDWTGLVKKSVTPTTTIPAGSNWNPAGPNTDRDLVWHLGSKEKGSTGTVSFTVEIWAEACHVDNTAEASAFYGDEQKVTASADAPTVHNNSEQCNEEEVNLPPVANAGVDQTLTLPTNSTNLDGSGSTDADGTIVSYVWDSVSGPSIIDPADSVNPAISGLVAGVYEFKLTVTDNDGATATDNVIITVNSGGDNGGDKPECSDGIDNTDSEDELVDANDPGCHSDGDVENSESYDPDDNSEVDEQTQTYICSDGLDNDQDGLADASDPGCHNSNSDLYDPYDNDETNSTSRGGGGGGSSGGSKKKSPGLVLGAETEKICDFAIDTYMRRGYKNNSRQVLILQALLNKYVGSKLVVDGNYGKATEEAVKAFQIKYKDFVLTPWGLTNPTGIFYKTSLVQAKNLECPAEILPVPDPLINWSKNIKEVPSRI